MVRHPAAPVRILIVHEEEGYGAGSPDLADLLLLAPTHEEILRRLPEALREYCGRDVEFSILRPREH